MGSIVAGIAMSHAPLIQATSAAPSETQEKNISRAMERLRAELAEAEPDAIIAIVDDHFENFFRPLMPSFALAVGPSNYGPPEHYVDWLGIQQREIPNDTSIANKLLLHLINHRFDVTRADRVSLGHAVVVPMQVIRPAFDIPIVPLLTNVFTYPQPTLARAIEIGTEIRHFIRSGTTSRIAILATGALSHWPPYWRPGDPQDNFLDRMRKFQEGGLQVLERDPNLFIDFNDRENEMAASGQRVINPAWDRNIIRTFESGALDQLASLSYEDVVRDGGHGGYEILNWTVLSAIMGGAGAETLAYEAVREWIGGIGILRYEPQSSL